MIEAKANIKNKIFNILLILFGSMISNLDDYKTNLHQFFF